MANFKINGKVAVVTGGASGLGYQFVVHLLQNGAKGVTIVDVSPQNVFEELATRFGRERVLLVQADTTDYGAFEDVFKKTVDTFKHVDILINNAGVFDDAHYQREVQINLTGTLNGVILAIDHYIPQNKISDEGVVVNIASLAGVVPSPYLPVYSATKSAICGLTLAWGHPLHYSRTKVRVVGVCPGLTQTPILDGFLDRTLSSEYTKLVPEYSKTISQKPEEVALNVMKVIERAPNGTLWLVHDGEPAYEYKPTDLSTMPKVFLE